MSITEQQVSSGSGSVPLLCGLYFQRQGNVSTGTMLLYGRVTCSGTRGHPVIASGTITAGIYKSVHTGAQSVSLRIIVIPSDGSPSTSTTVEVPSVPASGGVHRFATSIPVTVGQMVSVQIVGTSGVSANNPILSLTLEAQ